MRYIRVVYKTSKFDYVSSELLDGLIAMEKITLFYRPSEKKWIDVRFDPIRGKGGNGKYEGPERRAVVKPKEKETGKGFVEVKRSGANGQKSY